MFLNLKLSLRQCLTSMISLLIYLQFKIFNSLVVKSAALKGTLEWELHFMLQEMNTSGNPEH